MYRIASHSLSDFFSSFLQEKKRKLVSRLPRPRLNLIWITKYELTCKFQRRLQDWSTLKLGGPFILTFDEDITVIQKRFILHELKRASGYLRTFYNALPPGMNFSVNRNFSQSTVIFWYCCYGHQKSMLA